MSVEKLEGAMTHAVHQKPLLLTVLLASLGTLSCVASTNSPGSPRGGTGGGGAGGAGGTAPPTGSPNVPDGEVYDLPPAVPTAKPYDVRPPEDGPAAQVALHSRVCQALQNGPFTPVMAQTIFSEKAPPIKSDGQANRLTLSGRSQVFVTMTAAKAGEYVFFATLNQVVAVFTLDGSQLNEKTLYMSIQECAQVKYRVSFDLQAGASYVVRLGMPPVAMGVVPPTVDLVVAPQ
jgi:hypothetical protein